MTPTTWPGERCEHFGVEHAEDGGQCTLPGGHTGPHRFVRPPPSPPASEPPSATVPPGAEAMAPAKKSMLDETDRAWTTWWERARDAESEVASLRASLARSIPVEEVEALAVRMQEFAHDMEGRCCDRSVDLETAALYHAKAQAYREAEVAARALAARHGATTGGGR